MENRVTADLQLELSQFDKLNYHPHIQQYINYYL